MQVLEIWLRLQKKSGRTRGFIRLRLKASNFRFFCSFGLPSFHKKVKSLYKNIVAPVNRGYIAIGNILFDALIAALQGLFMQLQLPVDRISA